MRINDKPVTEGRDTAETRPCDFCGTLYEITADIRFKLKKGDGRFCSRKCWTDNGWAKTPQEHVDEVVDKSPGPDACWPVSGAPNSSGYPMMDTDEVLPNGKRRRIGVHQYALEQKLGRKLIQSKPGFKGEVSRHICHNSLCANPNHLIVGSQKDNLEDMRLAGRRKRTGPPGGQLDPDKVRFIFREYADGRGRSQMELARLLGVAQGTISLVLRRKIWTHVILTE